MRGGALFNGKEGRGDFRRAILRWGTKRLLKYKWLRNEDFRLNRLAFSEESRIFAAEKI